MARFWKITATTTLTGCALLLGMGVFHATGAPQTTPPLAPGTKKIGSDSVSLKSIPPSAKPLDKNWANLDMDEWRHDEQTGIDTGRNFVYREGDTVVTGMSAHYNGKSKVLDAEGNLAVDDSKHHVTGDKAHVDNSKLKLAVITSHVIIVLKPGSGSDAPGAGANVGAAKPAPEPDQATAPKENAIASPDGNAGKTDGGAKERNRGVTITCDHVDDYYKRNQMVLKGHLTFKQHIVKANGETVDRTLTAEHAEYDGKTEKLKLFAPVAAFDSDGQETTFTGDVIVGTKTGMESLSTDKRTKGHFKVETGDDQNP